MHPTGFSICPMCGNKNKLKVLFTSKYYEDCKKCGKINAKSNKYKIEVMRFNINGSYEISIFDMSSKKPKMLTHSSEHSYGASQRTTQNMYKQFGGKGEAMHKKWDTIYLDEYGNETQVYSMKGFKIHSMEFEGQKIKGK